VPLEAVSVGGLFCFDASIRSDRRNGDQLRSSWAINPISLLCAYARSPLPSAWASGMMLSSFVQSHSPGTKHTCDQTAKHDVIGNVHSAVPAMHN
jgi:hypothetical protein